MKGLQAPPAIYLYRRYVDFRKSINGLVAIVTEETDLPIHSGALFLFTNKQKDKVKILYWDTTGFALWYKRLERATFKWPSQEKEAVFNLSNDELERLLSGFTIIGHKAVELDEITLS